MKYKVCQDLEMALKERYTGWEGASQLEGTGDRLERMVDELFWSPLQIMTEVVECLSHTYPQDYSEVLVIGPIDVTAFCPHHILPCKFSVFIGYIPKGDVLGLSKFTRVATVMGRRPIMQEQYSQELAEVLWKYLNPIGLGVYVTGTHGCMSFRGVKQEVPISTSVLKGEFMDKPEVRQEFYAVCRQGN